jgi:hypothetical protein
MGFLYFYIAFSYLFQIGARTVGVIPTWNILFAPIVFPISLGRMCHIITIK